MCLKEKPKLKNLAIGFGQTQQNNDDGVVALAEALNNMTKLSSLHISLEDTQISQHSMIDIFKSLINIRNLEILKLNFGKTQIKDDLPFEALANSLATMNNLKELSVEVFETNISDHVVKNLSRSLGDKQKLRLLELGFGKSILQDPTTMKEFSLTITRLDQLEKFSLVLYKTKLGDDGITDICDSLGVMKQLEHLTLTFGKT